MRIAKKILAIIVIGLFVLLVGLAGELDHDEYIEANSVSTVKLP